MANSNLAIKGFNIRDAVFQNALSIPCNDNSVKTQFYLRPQSFGGDMSWSEYQLYGLLDEAWMEICKGSIQVEYEEKNAMAGSWEEASKEYESYLQI